MNNPSPFQPIDLAPKLAHEQRLKELVLQKKLDKSWGIKQEKILDARLQMNIRFIQYGSQFGYSRDFRILQCIRDFNRWLTVLQSGPKVDFNSPVAMDFDEQLIYCDDKNDLEMFTLIKPVKE